MARIREYSPRTTSQTAGVGSVRADPNSFGAALGRGLQSAGQDVSDAGEEITRIETLKDTTDLAQKLAQVKADEINQIDLENKQNTLDPEKSRERVSEKLGELVGSAKTGRGRSWAERQAASAEIDLYSTAYKTSAHSDGLRATVGLKNTFDNQGAIVRSNPSLWAEQYSDALEALQNTIELGKLDPDKQAELRSYVDKSFTYARVRGQNDLSKDAAMYTLEQLKFGEFDAYVSGDEKEKLIDETNASIRGYDVEAKRLKEAEDDALKAERELVQNQFLELLDQGKLSSKMVLGAEVLHPVEGPGSKKAFLAMIEGRKTFKNNMRLAASLYSRAVQGEFERPEDVMGYIEEIGIGNYKNIALEITGGKTAKGQIRRAQIKAFEEQAKKVFIGADDIFKAKDPEGPLLYYQTLMEAKQFEEEQVAKDIPMSEIYDRNNPNSVYKILNRNSLSGQDKLKKQFDTMKQKPAGTPVPGATPVAPQYQQRESETRQQFIDRVKRGGN